MTLDQLGAIANLTGYAVPLAFSLSISRTYARPYFMSWTLSYLFFAASILLLNFAQTQPLILSLAVVVYQVGTRYILETSRSLRPDTSLKCINRRLWWVITIAAPALALAGQSFANAMIGPVLLVLWAHLCLSRELLRVAFPPHQHGHQWLSALVAANGLWILAFPVLINTPWGWTGYVVSGVIHLLMGIQMVIFLLEDVAWTQKQQYEALQQLDRMKSSFISTVSHELRTPLTAIKSAAWLIGSPKVPPEELKTIIAQQTDALTHLVTDMLDASLIESGAMAFHKSPVCLRVLAQQAVVGMRPLLEEKGLAVELDVPDQPVEVTADPARLQQVLTNLLSNAAKFTPSGRVVVRVMDEGAQARLEVEDTGIGLAPEEQAKIFERFYQVDHASTRKVGGSGLGLAISKAIVEEGHRGRLWVESQLGRGSTFVVSLPRTNG